VERSLGGVAASHDRSVWFRFWRRAPAYALSGVSLFVASFWALPPDPKYFYANGGDDFEACFRFIVAWFCAPVGAVLVSVAERMGRRATVGSESR